MQRGGHDGRALCLDAGQQRRGTVVFVVDLPHDLLEDVLEGDDPGAATVLVDDDRKLIAALAEIDEQLVEIARLGDGRHGSHEFGDQGRRPVLDRHAVHRLHVNDAEHVVEILACHRETTVTCA